MHPIEDVADGLESMGLDVDRGNLVNGELVATDGTEMVYTNIPKRAPDCGLTYTRELNAREQGDDPSDLSTMRVAIPGEATPMEELDVDLHELFETIDTLFDNPEAAAEAIAR